MVQEGRARSTCVLVLCLQFPHSNIRWLCRLRSQLCQHKVRELENLLHCHWGVDHGRRAFGCHVSTRFSRQGEAVYRRREGRCVAAGQRKPKVSWGLHNATSGTRLTGYKWDTKRSHQKRPGLRNVQRPSCMADLPRYPAEFHSQRRTFQLFEYSPDNLWLHIPASTHTKYPQWRDWCSVCPSRRLPIR